MSVAQPVIERGSSFISGAKLRGIAWKLAKVVFQVALTILGAGLLWEVIYLLLVEVFHVWISALFPSPLDVVSSALRSSSGWQSGTGDWYQYGSVNHRLWSVFAAGGADWYQPVSSKWARRLIGPIVLGFQALPSVCWLPLAILWFGLNESAIIFVVIMGSVFSITIATYDSTKLMSPLLMKAAHNMGVKGWGMFWRVVLPASPTGDP